MTIFTKSTSSWKIYYTEISSSDQFLSIYGTEKFICQMLTFLYTIVCIHLCFYCWLYCCFDRTFYTSEKVNNIVEIFSIKTILPECLTSEWGSWESEHSLYPCLTPSQVDVLSSDTYVLLRKGSMDSEIIQKCLLTSSSTKAFNSKWQFKHDSRFYWLWLFTL